MAMIDDNVERPANSKFKKPVMSVINNKAEEECRMDCKIEG
jgi:hypothetical protein